MLAQVRHLTQFPVSRLHKELTFRTQMMNSLSTMRPLEEGLFFNGQHF
jgi:hypothetical protein